MWFDRIFGAAERYLAELEVVVTPIAFNAFSVLMTYIDM